MRVVLPIVLVAGLTSCAGESRDQPTSGSITIVVVLPDEWPDAIYPDEPEITIEHGWQARFPTTGMRTDISLPEPGQYRVGAITGDGGCFDTAGVTIAGNPTVDVRDGDTVELVDTGEICD